jgi:hypothetical protein
MSIIITGGKARQLAANSTSYAWSARAGSVTASRANVSNCCVISTAIWPDFPHHSSTPRLRAASMFWNPATPVRPRLKIISIKTACRAVDSWSKFGNREYASVVASAMVCSNRMVIWT